MRISDWSSDVCSSDLATWLTQSVCTARPIPGSCRTRLAGLPMNQLDFQLDRDFIELNQLLKLVGVCDSGGAGKALVASGTVRVDGEVELRKTCKIRAGQRVEVGRSEEHTSELQSLMRNSYAVF